MALSLPVSASWVLGSHWPAAGPVGARRRLIPWFTPFPAPLTPPRFTFSANAVTGTEGRQVASGAGVEETTREGRGPGVRVWAQDSPSWSVLACRSHCKRVEASATLQGPGVRSGLGGSKGPGARVAGSSGRRSRAGIWSRTSQERGCLGAQRPAVRGPRSPARPALQGRGAAPEGHPSPRQAGSWVSGHWTCAGRSRVHVLLWARPAPAPYVSLVANSA